jgi:rubrerythrin
MKTNSPSQDTHVESGTTRVPVEHDADWEYTGVVYACADCGFEFEDYPPDFDVCPKCGADVWQDGE